MEIKKHFKLYKSGKQWLVAAVATIAVSAGLAMTQQVANADTVTATPDTTTAVTAKTDDQDSANADQATPQQSTAVKQDTTDQQSTKVTGTSNQTPNNGKVAARHHY